MLYLILLILYLILFVEPTVDSVFDYGQIGARASLLIKKRTYNAKRKQVNKNYEGQKDPSISNKRTRIEAW